MDEHDESAEALVPASKSGLPKAISRLVTRKPFSGSLVGAGLTLSLAGLVFLGITTNAIAGGAALVVGLPCLVWGWYLWRHPQPIPHAHLHPESISAVAEAVIAKLPPAGALDWQDAQLQIAPITPRIIATARFWQGYLNDEGQIHFGRDEKLMRPNSFVMLATFRNEPPSRTIKSLSASIIYYNNNPAGTGFWLRSTKPTVDLDIGCEQSVALIYAVPPTLSDDGSAFMIIDERQAATGKLAYVAFPHSLSCSAPPEQSTTDTVGLTVAEAGTVLGTATYQVGFGSGNPVVMSVDWQPIKSTDVKQSDVILEQLIGEAELKREFRRLEAETPDVIMELDVTRVDSLSYEEPPIYVFNGGSLAEDVRVDAIEAGDWIAGFTGDDSGGVLRGVPAIANAFLKFQPVPHVKYGQLTPIPYGIESQSAVMRRAGLWFFIDCAMEHKQYEVMAGLLGGGTLTEMRAAQAAAYAKKDEPLEQPIRMTYGNAHNARRWERVELLHYHPDSRRAYISHGSPVEITAQSEIKELTAFGEPDLLLRFIVPNKFMLDNRGGDATEATIVAVDAYVKPLGGNKQLVVPERTIIFSPVDIKGGDSGEIVPTHSHSKAGRRQPTMVDFLEALVERSSVFMVGRDDPIDVEMKLIYNGRLTGNVWEKIETLIYEPDKGGFHIKHGLPRKVFE